MPSTGGGSLGTFTFTPPPAVPKSGATRPSKGGSVSGSGSFDHHGLLVATGGSSRSSGSSSVAATGKTEGAAGMIPAWAESRHDSMGFSHAKKRASSSRRSPTTVVSPGPHADATAKGSPSSVAAGPHVVTPVAAKAKAGADERRSSGRGSKAAAATTAVADPAALSAEQQRARMMLLAHVVKLLVGQAQLTQLRALRRWHSQVTAAAKAKAKAKAAKEEEEEEEEYEEDYEEEDEEELDASWQSAEYSCPRPAPMEQPGAFGKPWRRGHNTRDNPNCTSDCQDPRCGGSGGGALMRDREDDDEEEEEEIAAAAMAMAAAAEEAAVEADAAEAAATAAAATATALPPPVPRATKAARGVVAAAKPAASASASASASAATPSSTPATKSTDVRAEGLMVDLDAVDASALPPAPPKAARAKGAGGRKVATQQPPQQPKSSRSHALRVASTKGGAVDTHPHAHPHGACNYSYGTRSRRCPRPRPTLLAHYSSAQPTPPHLTSPHPTPPHPLVNPKSEKILRKRGGIIYSRQAYDDLAYSAPGESTAAADTKRKGTQRQPPSSQPGPAEVDAEAPLPPGWVEHTVASGASKGTLYYHNEETGELSFDRPAPVPVPVPVRSKAEQPRRRASAGQGSGRLTGRRRGAPLFSSADVDAAMEATMGGGHGDSEAMDSGSEDEGGQGGPSTFERRARRRARSQIGGSATSASLPSASSMVKAEGGVASSAVFSKPLARLAASGNVGRSLSGFRDGRGPVSHGTRPAPLNPHHLPGPSIPRYPAFAPGHRHSPPLTATAPRSRHRRRRHRSDPQPCHA